MTQHFSHSWNTGPRNGHQNIWAIKLVAFFSRLCALDSLNIIVVEVAMVIGVFVVIIAEMVGHRCIQFTSAGQKELRQTVLNSLRLYGQKVEDSQKWLKANMTSDNWKTVHQISWKDRRDSKFDDLAEGGRPFANGPTTKFCLRVCFIHNG